MPEITLPLNWRPRPYQMEAWRALESGCKRVCLVWHRRAGKDLFAENWIATQILQRVGQYWHVLPTYRQGRQVVWEGRTKDGRSFLSHFPEDAIVRRRDDEMRLWFANGSTYNVVGADDPDKLVGTNPVGIVFSEWSLMSDRVWDLTRPILAENGGWAIFIYTPRGRNNGYRTFEMARKHPDWFAQVLTVADTKAVSQAAIDAERAAGMPEEMIQQEFYCSFDAPLVGSYYGDLLTAAKDQGRIGRVPWDPTLPVVTAWDLGMSDSTAIWFMQEVNKEIRAIDYYENSGVGLDHYNKILREKPYAYTDHVGPHDATVRELGSGKSRIETLASMGVRMRAAPKLGLADGISAARMLLPQMWIDEEKCSRGLQALREYTKQRKEGEQGPDGKPVYRDDPKHDWTSHAADALRTYATGRRRVLGASSDRIAPKIAIV